MKINNVFVAFSLIFLSKADTSENNRRKRANQDNFNILLSMYKLNPLKHSNVFKTFSKHVLLPRSDLADLNLNTKESNAEKEYRIDLKKQYDEIDQYSTDKLNKSPVNNEHFKESLDSGHLDNLLSFNQIDVDEKSNDDDIFGNAFVLPKKSKQKDKDNLIYKADNANTIDLDPNIYILKKKRKHKKKSFHKSNEIIIA